MSSRTRQKFEDRQPEQYWRSRLPDPPTFFKTEYVITWNLNHELANNLCYLIADAVYLCFNINTLKYSILYKKWRTKYTGNIEKDIYGPFDDMDTAITWFKLHLLDEL